MTQLEVASYADDSNNNLSTTAQHSPLFHLLSNSLILCHLTPYLSSFDILNLSATSRAFHYLAYNTPQVFRRVDLSQVKTAQFDIDGIDHGGETWRNVQVDENLTEDEFYSGPLRGIFSSLRRSNILQDMQILILDGLSVTADLVHDLLIDPAFNIRILSIRDAKNLNERKLQTALQYACRETRPESMPRLKGLYVFGPKDPAPRSASNSPDASPRLAANGQALGVSWNNRSQKALTASLVEQPEPWYVRRGGQFPRPVSSEWASTLVACSGIIAFDAVLCSSPRHINSPAYGKVDLEMLNRASSLTNRTVPSFGVATYSLSGCAGCGAAPEGWTTWGEEESYARAPDDRRSSRGSICSEVGRFPLLAPPPLHSASVKVAMCPTGQPVNSHLAPSAKEKAQFIPRCADCLRDRYCAGCHRWWCESCYTGPWAASSGQTTAADAGANLVSTSPNTSTGNRGPKYKVLDGLCLDGGCRRFHHLATRRRASSIPRGILRRIADI